MSWIMKTQQIEIQLFRQPFYYLVIGEVLDFTDHVHQIWEREAPSFD